MIRKLYNRTGRFVVVVILVWLCASCLKTAVTSSVLPTSGVIATTPFTPTPSRSMTKQPAIPTKAIAAIPSPTSKPTTSSTNTVVPTVLPYADPRKSMAPGQYIVYWQKNIWYMKALGDSPAVRLMPFESVSSLSALSPDGNRVAFEDARFLFARAPINVFDLSSGELATYQPSGEGESWVDSLEWSPDGTMLLYSTLDGFRTINEYSIYVLLLDEKRTLKLVAPQGELQYGGYAASWSPDGRWISFIGRLPGKTDYEVDERPYLLDTSCIEEDAATCMDKIKQVGANPYPTWSPDGQLTLYCRMGNQTGPCVVSVDDLSSPRLLADIHRLEEGTISKRQRFWWSPNGDYLGFVLSHVDEQGYESGDVYIISLSSGQVNKLTNLPNEAERFAGWSPDGQYLVYWRFWGFEAEEGPSGEHEGIYNFYVVSMKGGDPVMVIGDPDHGATMEFWLVVPNDFQIGQSYAITSEGDDLNLRSTPSLDGTIMTRLDTGETVTILEGPVEADGYKWWRMRTADGIEGWAVEVAGWYEAVTP